MIAFYFDVHVPAPLLKACRRRGLDVLTSQEDGTRTLMDDALLQRATTLGRVIVTEDKDFERLAASALRTGAAFTGVILLGTDCSVAQLAEEMEVVAKAEDPQRLQQGVYHLPLR